MNDDNDKEQIVSIGIIKHFALKTYLNSRGINIALAKKYCKEIHYFKDGNKSSSDIDVLLKEKRKPFFALGFENDLGGYEIRNKFFKGCLKTKAITTITNGSKTLNLFEGFIDFLSYLTLMPHKEKEDFIITNSTSIVKNAIEALSKYDTVKAFFDNDFSGANVTKLIQENCKKEFLNESLKFEKYKDVNEYLISLNK